VVYCHLLQLVSVNSFAMTLVQLNVETCARLMANLGAMKNLGAH
jgi:hypothetical protein